MALAGDRAGEVVSAHDPRYAEVVEFLYHEAELLDTRHFSEWLALLCDDITYRMPVRLNSSHNSERPDYSESSDIFSDSLASLKVRVDKLRTNYAWAESPASRTRHFVSNIRVRASDRVGELAVSSYLLVYRNRGATPEADIFSGERQDVLRNVNGEWRLASRLILLDQAVIGANNISILF